MKQVGKIDWAFSSGRVPFKYHGKEPEMISNDRICVLNATTVNACVELFIFYESAPPVGPYTLEVKPQRIRKIRFNDLIDPEAIQLERNFSCYIRSTVKIVVQMSRMNTGARANAEMSTIAFPVDT